VKYNYGEYNYSNLGYIILGAICEKIAGTDYYSAMKKYVFKPLKMRYTGVGKTDMTLYLNNVKLSKKYYLERYLASSVGAFYSCVQDLVLFGNNFTKLLGQAELSIFFSLYFVKNNIIKHHGGIYGESSRFEIKFGPNYKVTEVDIKIGTN
jgi:CubicO group peptidase (beta-lactamase class C family)